MSYTAVNLLLFVLTYSGGMSISWPYAQAYFNDAVDKEQLSYLLSFRNMTSQIISFGIFSLLSAFDGVFKLKQSLDNYNVVNILILMLMIAILGVNLLLHRTRVSTT
jgi:hypothetical protein